MIDKHSQMCYNEVGEIYSPTFLYKMMTACIRQKSEPQKKTEV